MTTTPPDPGEGYRLLEVGEIVRENDDLLNLFRGGKWAPPRYVGSIYDEQGKESGLYYRRRIDPPATPKQDDQPGECWRWLDAGEPLREGDELDLGENRWQPIKQWLGAYAGGPFLFRRRINPTEEPIAIAAVPIQKGQLVEIQNGVATPIPSHYQGVQPWDLQRAMKPSGSVFVDARLADVLEYVARWNRKHETRAAQLEDLRKAAHCLQAAISEIEGM